MPAPVVGGSPFDGSVANSTLTSDSSRATSSNDRVVETDEEILAFFTQDYNERGDGGDSDEEGGGINIHHEATILNREEQGLRDEANDIDAEEEGIPGSPRGWEPPGPPDGWAGYRPKHDAPQERDVDNPGGWSNYTFQPKYNKEKEYVDHYTPSGAIVVPENDDGRREMGGYQFYYEGWSPDDFDKETFVRDDATRKDLRPASRMGRLDIDVLKKHGLTKERLEKDPLFFFQLLLPICNPKLSGIEGDDRIPYFTHVRTCTNMYAVGQKGWGGGYGHEYKLTNEAEMVNWTGVSIRHGAREGNPGSYHTRWCKDDPNYDEMIARSMTSSRFQQVKSVFKLNDNVASPKRGMEGYDPASKYDHIYKTMCHNMNYVTDKADLDCGIDESTWGFSGYCGDAGWRLKNKPKAKG